MGNDNLHMASIEIVGCAELDGPRIRLAWPPKNNMGCLTEAIRFEGGHRAWHLDSLRQMWALVVVVAVVLEVWWLMSGVEAPIRTKQKQARGR